VTAPSLLGYVPASTARCDDCGEPLELVWLLRSRRADNGAPYIALCAKCANARQPACRWAELFYCGGCGRGVRRPDAWRSVKYPACTDECRKAARAAAMRAARKRAPRVCERDGCSEKLVPTRESHRYHSKRCADAAGEARRKAKAKPARTIVLPPRRPSAATVSLCRCDGPANPPEDDGAVTCARCGHFQKLTNLSQLAEDCLDERERERARQSLLELSEVAA